MFNVGGCVVVSDRMSVMLYVKCYMRNVCFECSLVQVMEPHPFRVAPAIILADRDYLLLAASTCYHCGLGYNPLEERTPNEWHPADALTSANPPSDWSRRWVTVEQEAVYIHSVHLVRSVRKS